MKQFFEMMLFSLETSSLQKKRCSDVCAFVKGKCTECKKSKCVIKLPFLPPSYRVCYTSFVLCGFRKKSVFWTMIFSQKPSIFLFLLVIFTKRFCVVTNLSFCSCLFCFDVCMERHIKIYNFLGDSVRLRIILISTLFSFLSLQTPKEAS